MKSKHTRNKVIIELSPAEFEMTRALVSAGAGDRDYENSDYCGTKANRSMCAKVTDWWRFRNHDQQLHGLRDEQPEKAEYNDPRTSFGSGG